MTAFMDGKKDINLIYLDLVNALNSMDHQLSCHNLQGCRDHLLGLKLPEWPYGSTSMPAPCLQPPRNLRRAPRLHFIVRLVQ